MRATASLYTRARLIKAGNIVPFFILIGLLTLFSAYIYKHTRGWQPRGAELAPPDSVIFVHVPNLQRSGRAMAKTHLGKMLGMKERLVQSGGGAPRMRAERAATDTFSSSTTLNAPTVPADDSPSEDECFWQKGWESLTSITPLEAFIAIKPDGNRWKFLSGVAFAREPRDVATVLDPLRKNLRARWARGGAQRTVAHGRGLIEVCTAGDHVFADTVVRGWYFCSTDLSVLQSTLDRLDKRGEAGLASRPSYQRSFANLPPSPDAALFVRSGILAEYVAQTLAQTLNIETADAQEFSIQNEEAIFASVTRIDGMELRETSIETRNSGVTEAVLSCNTMSLTGADTVLYHAARVDAAARSRWIPMARLLPGWREAEDSVKEHGVDSAQVLSAFGGEACFILDWSKTAQSPTLLLGVDLKDSTPLRNYLENALLAADESEPVEWAKTEGQGGACFTLTPLGSKQSTFAVGIGEHYAVVSPNAEAVSRALARSENTAERTDAFHALCLTASRRGPRPTESFWCIDAPRILERGYPPFRASLSLSLALSPEAGEFVSSEQLPSLEQLLPHLVPIVASRYQSPEGTMQESSGAITLNQAGVLVGLGSAFALLPQESPTASTNDE